ncbi:hypothetical protein K523DRAFT_420420 [Schizophyllum commune Tattone D]|nr:hypothetical protein K525DRAFT_239016 [Schizophyllum commune Loenen D]KAI5824927.1 hypothetical protein K523DRAFT_420420 [Schizophyllum commune Tattone D]
MPVPWEALLPLGIMTAFFGVTGTALNLTERVSNLGRSGRYNLDQWDTMMVNRDYRLTGHKRGQSTEPYAPEGYETRPVVSVQRIA